MPGGAGGAGAKAGLVPQAELVGLVQKAEPVVLVQKAELAELVPQAGLVVLVQKAGLVVLVERAVHKCHLSPNKENPAALLKLVTSTEGPANVWQLVQRHRKAAKEQMTVPLGSMLRRVYTHL